ncbi:MAG: nucleotidyltransferase family protein [Clostridia bacterium]|nr:nucleotidyltransferase family protein [Clostridia bacterium]
MKVAGIICECNPFHKGHAYLIESAKAAGAELVICLLSGYFTERAEPAIFDPYIRAKTMLCGGADLILEFPFPLCASGAECFGFSGIEILSKLGIDELWFGSESGDLERLKKLAKAADDPAFLAAYKESVKGEDGSAKAYFDLLQKFAKEKGEILPNDALGIQYLRAIDRLQKKIAPRILLRRGSGHDEEGLSEYSSASALRGEIESGRLSLLESHLPAGSLPILKDAIAQDRAPATLETAERAILWRLHSMKKEELTSLPELSGGLGERILQAAKKAASLDELLTLAATKKYPIARIRRGILFAMTGVTKEDLRTSPSYLRLLGATDAGRKFLSSLRKSAPFQIVTKQKDLPSSTQEEELEYAALSLYGLCLPKAKTPAFFLGLPPCVEK